MRSDRLHYFRFLTCSRSVYADIVRPKGGREEYMAATMRMTGRCGVIQPTGPHKLHLSIYPFIYLSIYPICLHLPILLYSFAYLSIPTYLLHSFIYKFHPSIFFISTTTLQQQDDNQSYNQLIHTQIKINNETSFIYLLFINHTYFPFFATSYPYSSK